MLYTADCYSIHFHFQLPLFLVDLCTDGMELQAGMGCVKCARGTYRKVESEDKCVACADGYTTSNEGTVTKEDCDLRK